jgi:virginiamycin B lyase
MMLRQLIRSLNGKRPPAHAVLRQATMRRLKGAALVVAVQLVLALAACRPSLLAVEGGAPDRQGPSPIPSAAVAATCTHTILRFPLPFPGEPNRMAVGTDGAIWFMLYKPGRSPRTERKLGRIATDGTITELGLPDEYVFIRDLVAGPDGALWLANGNPAMVSRLDRDGTLTEFPIPTESTSRQESAGPRARCNRETGQNCRTVTTVYGMPISLAAGPGGEVYFARSQQGMGVVTPDGRVEVITEGGFHGNGSSSRLLWGPDGALWSADYYGGHGRIARTTTAGAVRGFLSPFDDPTGVIEPYHAVALTAGPDGALWFTERYRARISRVTLVGIASSFALPSFNSAGEGITAGPDGAIWFTGSSDAVGRLSLSGEVQRFELPRDGPATISPHNPGAVVPKHIVTGPDGGIWFTVRVVDGQGWIGRLEPCTRATRHQNPEGPRPPR